MSSGPGPYVGGPPQAEVGPIQVDPVKAADTLNLINRGRLLNAILNPNPNQYRNAVLLGRLVRGEPLQHDLRRILKR